MRMYMSMYIYMYLYLYLLKQVHEAKKMWKVTAFEQQMCIYNVHSTGLHST